MADTQTDAGTSAVEAKLPATRAAFARALARQTTGGASFSATLDGAEVVTLSGGTARPGVAWDADTRTITMSMAKGLSGLVIAMLADRGRLDPDELVGTYWPEYATNGKESVRVKDFLLHTAGSLGFPRVDDVLSWDGKGWDDLDGIAAALAAAPPAWKPGTQAGYHAVTYGWLVGELVRRIDGRTLGQFFREEIAEPLGVRTAIGVPIADQGDLAIVHPEGMDRPPLLMRPIHGKTQRRMRDPETLIGQASLGNGTYSIFDTPLDFINQPFFAAAEVPASNGFSSARDMARVFAAVALGGELDGVRLFSRSTLERFTARAGVGPDTVLLSGFGPVVRKLMTKALTADRSFGFMVNPAQPGGRRPLGPGLHSVGAGGYGGQIVLADPDRRISLAFVRSALLWSQKEITALIAAFYQDLDNA